MLAEDPVYSSKRVGGDSASGVFSAWKARRVEGVVADEDLAFALARELNESASELRSVRRHWSACVEFDSRASTLYRRLRSVRRRVVDAVVSSAFAYAGQLGDYESEVGMAKRERGAHDKRADWGSIPGGRGVLFYSTGELARAIDRAVAKAGTTRSAFLRDALMSVPAVSAEMRDE